MGNKHEKKSKRPKDVETRAVEDVCTRLRLFDLEDRDAGYRHFLDRGAFLLAKQGRDHVRQPAAWVRRKDVRTLMSSTSQTKECHVHTANVFHCALSDDSEHALLGKLGEYGKDHR